MVFLDAFWLCILLCCPQLDFIFFPIIENTLNMGKEMGAGIIHTLPEAFPSTVSSWLIWPSTQLLLWENVSFCQSHHCNIWHDIERHGPYVGKWLAWTSLAKGPVLMLYGSTLVNGNSICVGLNWQAKVRGANASMNSSLNPLPWGMFNRL